MTRPACASDCRTIWKKPSLRGSRRGRSRRLRALLPAAALAGAALFCRQGSFPSPPTAVPRRIVTLAPNLTEIVFAIGAGDQLVAVSDFSDFPDAARSIPRVGGLDASVEGVVSFRPDLVLASRDGNSRGPVTALSAAGIPVLTVSGGSLDEVLDGIRRIGERLGRQKEAQRLVASLTARRARVRADSRGRARPSALLLVWPDPPQAAGGGTFLDDLLEEAGARNPLRNRSGWPVISAEYLATAPIDALVIPDSRASRPAYDRAFASGALSRGTVARARVVRIDESILTRPGPRVFDALETLARELHPPEVPPS
ncbi:MAG: ABC transporter substrate-binding protein [Thermoanaerobaculia bacterium]